MIINIISFLIFFVTRPLARYMLYPGSVALLVSSNIQEAEIMKPQIIEKGGQEIAITTEDGRSLDAMFFDVENMYPDKALYYKEGDRPLVIICGGNKSFYPRLWTMIKLYLDNGANVVAFNYGGFGESEGSTTTLTTYADADAIYDYATKNKGFTDDHLIVHGLSLGGAMASYLAEKHPIDVILDRTFARVGDVPKVPGLGRIANVFYPYNSVWRIKNFKGKIHLVGAIDDEVIAPFNTEKLFREVLKVRHPSATTTREIQKLREYYVTDITGGHEAYWYDEKDPRYHEVRQRVVARILPSTNTLAHSFTAVAPPPAVKTAEAS
jgi:uncharacterized protein